MAQQLLFSLLDSVEARCWRHEEARKSLFSNILDLYRWGGALGQETQTSQPEPSLRITVHVYNDAEVDHDTLIRAERVVMEIFRKAGVEVGPLDAPLSSKEEQGQGMEQLGPSDFFVHILSLKLAEPLGLRTYALGLAPGRADERNRNLVYVFDHVAESAAKEQLTSGFNGMLLGNADKAQILGYGMAHEIGHLLLGTNSHAPSGIMRARWGVQELCDMVSGTFLFATDEAERIRAEVVRRNQEQTAPGCTVLRSPPRVP